MKILTVGFSFTATAENVITLGAKRLWCAELLFQPGFIGKEASGCMYNTKCDADTRKEAYASVTLSIGTN